MIAGPLAEALHGIPDDYLRYARSEILQDAAGILAILDAMVAGEPWSDGE